MDIIQSTNNRFGIFFDLDGTLIDNEYLKALAFSRAIEHFGGNSDPAFYKDVMGMSGEVIKKHFISKAGISINPDEYMRLYKSIYMDLLRSHLVIRPGVIPLLQELVDMGFKLAVVSGAYSESVLYIINSLNLTQYFDLILTGDEIKNKKPDPESYLLALRKFSLTNDKVIVIEDTESGLRAANNAGIPCICIRHDFNESHDFSNAVAEFRSFIEEIDEMKNNMNRILNRKIL